MKKHICYLWYVIRHKFWVAYAGIKLGVPLDRLLLHDLSKFSKAEWKPYVNYFYGEKTKAVENSWRQAWKHHWENNDHHWQFWLFGETIVPMPEQALLEMVADWMGAGRAISGRWETKEWYDQNKHKIKLTYVQRKRVEELINEL